MTGSHYPSSRELADFRNRINPDPIMAAYNGNPAAWDWERGTGIGWRYRNDSTPSTNILGARQDAGILRSRAYASGGMVGGYLSDGRQLVECTAQGCRYAYDPRAGRHHTVDCFAWRKDDELEAARNRH